MADPTTHGSADNAAATTDGIAFKPDGSPDAISRFSAPAKLVTNQSLVPEFTISSAAADVMVDIDGPDNGISLTAMLSPEQAEYMAERLQEHADKARGYDQ